MLRSLTLVKCFSRTDLCGPAPPRPNGLHRKRLFQRAPEHPSRGGGDDRALDIRVELMVDGHAERESRYGVTRREPTPPLPAIRDARSLLRARGSRQDGETFTRNARGDTRGPHP